MKKRRSFIRNLLGLGLISGIASLWNQSSAQQAPEKLFIHHVFFWLNNPGDNSERKKFEKALKKLVSIETISMCHIGTPANTDREVIDNSYHYSLLLGFKSEKEHEIYQKHPIHDDFRNKSDLWNKVLVYDSIDI